MSEGFYRYGNDPEEVMLSVIIDRERDVDAWSYLHGMCGVFALALSQEFGYPIWIIQDSKDGPVLESLIHVFCVVNNTDGRKQYIDARGVTTNEDRFLQSFGKFFDSPVYREFMPKEVELLMKDDLGTAYEYFLDCAKKAYLNAPGLLRNQGGESSMRYRDAKNCTMGMRSTLKGPMKSSPSLRRRSRRRTYSSDVLTDASITTQL